ncbi:thioredoxin-like domain-containing protein [Pseudokineococcus sp. 1T1Z-3]|uniref:thioredoxin-like domain-containing protein n=1 Tax=Pseudokineococcus sp. 1T1Z-3 TaxID=3132745 RepID=UPI0030B2B87D
MRTGTRTSARTRAPELVGRRWVGTDGAALRLADLRGRFVLLDFWTSCCVNCLHVLDELRPLEQRWAAELVVVGVHSPKFPHEAEPGVLDDAVRRYEVHHPVLDDADLTTWGAYAARAWPTLVLVDPTGYVVASLSGEGHAHGLDALLTELVPEHDARGTLVRGGRLFTPLPEEAPDDGLRFPSSALVLPEHLGGGVLVTDTGHHRLAVLDDDQRVVRSIGSGVRGLADGDGGAAALAEPQGLCLLPDDVAARLGADVVVADSANHAVRGVRLARGDQEVDHVVTLAGTGRQLRRREGGGAALAQDLSTPWDVAWWDDQLVVAMAGLHQLWALDLAPDPADGVVRVLAGTSAEGLRDGDAEQAWFAQTSRLVPSADGAVLWVVDAETSALRRLTRTGAPDRSVPTVTDTRLANAAPVASPGYRVETVVGSGLFDFGDRDGAAGEALLQHPLGAAVLPDGSVAVADTYNGAVRRYDPSAPPGAPAVTTLAADLAEPTGLAVVGEGADAELLVVESRAHRLLRLPLPAALQAGRVSGTAAGRVERPPQPLAPGAVRLRVRFTPPAGQHLDDRYGSPVRVLVSATPPGLLAEGGGTATDLERLLVLDGAAGATGVLHVSAQAAACDAGEDGTPAEHAACHLYQQDWGLPVVLAADASDTLDLDLRGVIS